MHRKVLLFTILAMVGILALSACNGDATTAAPAAPPTPVPTDVPPEPTEVTLSGSVSNGGKAYDKWWVVAGVEVPDGDQPAWALQSTNERNGADTWRCKECHGWDYQGADGAYGSGSHFTGFPGVLDSAGLSHAELLAWLDGTTNEAHDFSSAGEGTLADLVVFLSEGLIDVSPFIDADKMAIGGNLTNGEALFTATCVACHGADGRMINFHDPEEPEFVGNIAVDNPWEFIHKVRAGQPGSNPPMPSAIDSGWSMQDVVDVLAYAQTLPTEPPPPGSVSRGGLLYDKWWTVVGLDEPTDDNPLWDRQDTNTRSGGDTWRCKECHGWDYMGSEGAYGSGSHFTGFPGVFDAQEMTLDELVAMITGGVDPDHDYSVIAANSTMGNEVFLDLASFLKEGLVDVSPFIDADTKAAIGGDATNGEALYMATCAACHGEDGRLVNFHDPEEPEFVGNIAVDNPWEFFHKVRAGQPGTQMPSAIDLGWSLQDVLDVLTFAQGLPTDPP